MPKSPEAPSSQEIVDKLESLRPTIGETAQKASEHLWGIPGLKICNQIEYREEKDWLSAPSPFNYTAKVLACYFEKIHQVGVNLTAFREYLRHPKQKSIKSALDPTTRLAVYVLVHENFIHANCRKKPIENRKQTAELVEWAKALCTEIGEDGLEYLPTLNHPGIRVKNIGVQLQYTNQNNESFLTIGHYFNEALSHLISSHVFSLVYSAITGRNAKEGAFVYLGQMSVPSGLQDEDMIAVSDFYRSDFSEVARNYFSGDFFTRYVFTLPEEKRIDALTKFFGCGFSSFYEAITPGLKPGI